MIDAKTLDEFGRRLREALPEGMAVLPEELRSNLRSILSSTLAKADLVTREEFDIQGAVLARTREKVDALEATLSSLEARVLRGAGDQEDRGSGDSSR